MINPFTKRKDILAVILTSTDIKRLQRCFKTLLDTQPNCSMDIEIMINTLDATYPQQVYQAFKNEKVKIVESPSDGTAPKGKNYVLDHFRHHKGKYNYLMLIDGDDFYYPTAFECFEKVLQHNPDIIGLQNSDVLTLREKDPDSEFFHWVQDDIYMNSWNDYELNLNLKFTKDVSRPVSQQHPPDRVMFMSENVLKNEKDLYFPEELRVYSDYAFDVFLYERAINHGYSYVHFCNSYAYVYDRLNEAAVTKTYKDFGVQKKDIDEAFSRAVKDSVERCNNNVDFKIIPFFKLGPPKTPFGIERKMEFIKENLIINHNNT